MVQILSRGENVYTCDVCKRNVRLSANRRGLDIMQRCIITKGCRGTLHRVTNSKEIANTPTLTPAAEGLDDWFQRKVLFNYSQTSKSKEWRVEHNLGNIPAVQVFVYRTDPETLKEVLYETTSGVVTSTATTTTVKFDTAADGFVQCLSLSSTTIPVNAETVTPYETITNAGELTLATADDTPSINLVVRYTNTFTGEFTDVTYDNVDNAPSVNSPWVGVSAVLLNGKKYFVRSFNIITTARGPAFFDALTSSSGLSISFPQLEGTFNTNVLLLGKSPYTSVDRIPNKYIDIGSMQSRPGVAILVGQDISIESDIIRDVYPRIVPL